MDVIERIKQLAKERNWTEYRLVKESGLSASTISNIYHRGTIPSIPTLEELCKTFDISLAQFFNEEDAYYLTDDQRAMIDIWMCLDSEQKTALLKFIQTLR